MLIYKQLALLLLISFSVYNGRSFPAYFNRLCFLVKTISARKALRPFLLSGDSTFVGRLVSQRPEILGAVEWPYVTNRWDVEARLKKIHEHYQVIERLQYRIDIPFSGALTLTGLDDMHPGLRVVIDQPKWFMREGQLVMNLFIGKLRIFSLAFSFSEESGNPVVYIGAIQGRSLDGMLDTYRGVTKSMYGLRPRDLLFEIFRIFCRHLGVVRIYAVSDACRHHRSAYFGVNANTIDRSINYDAVWIERGGVCREEGFFEFSVNSVAKPLEEVPSKKRSLYRQRHQLMEILEERISRELSCLDDISKIENPFHSL